MQSDCGSGWDELYLYGKLAQHETGQIAATTVTTNLHRSEKTVYVSNR